MATDINSVTLVGRLTRDPELKSIGESSLVNFSLAVNKKINKDKEETYYFDCEIWGKLAEVLKQYATKGKQIAIDGSLKQDVWDSPEGKRSKVKIRVENFQLLGGNSQASNALTTIEEMGTEVDPNDIF